MGITTDIPSIDYAALRELSSLMEEAFPELLQAFITDAGKIVEGLQRALTSNDLSSASKLAHTLKGSSANIGAPRLSDLCKVLNMGEHEGEIDDFSAIVAKIDHEFEVVKGQLNQFLQEAGQ